MPSFPTIPGYDLGAELGRGATGVVYEAVHRATGAEVAIKAVRPDSDRTRAALRHELLAMARLNHPNVLFLYDTGVVDEPEPWVWMALERATGGTLDGWRPQAWSEIEDVLYDLLAGLAHAHARGVLHRDLKPANLLVARSSDERPGLKVADFGLTSLRDRGTIYKRGGTPLYMPPEQARTDRGPAGTWSDVYALGAILWLWVCGQPPFSQGGLQQIMEAHASRPLPPLRPAFPVPDAVLRALPRMLAKQPGERPATVAAVRQALELAAEPALLEAPDRSAGSARQPGLGVALVPLRAWRLVGRREAWEQLRGDLRQVSTEGAPLVRLITGPAGIGKTHLARAFGESAAEAGVARLAWLPTDLGRILALASTGPVVACVDELDGPTEELVASLAFARAPVLILATSRHPHAWPDLPLLPRFGQLPLGPMAPVSFRRFLTEELGVDRRLSTRMDRACGYVPGVATAWWVQLSRASALRPGPSGLSFDDALLAAPPVLDRDDAAARDALWAHVPASEQDAVRLAALVGDVVASDVLEGALDRLGWVYPRGAFVELARLGWLLPHPSGHRWSDPGLRADVAEGASPRQHRALAEVLGELDPSAAGRLARGRHLIEAGAVDDALALLISTEREVLSGDQEWLHEAVELLRDHLEEATVAQRAGWLCMELNVVFNMASRGAAVPLAQAAIRAVGRPGAPGTLGPDVASELQHRILVLAALVLSFDERGEEALAVLDGLPESAATLRIRGRVWTERGHTDDAVRTFLRAMDLAETQALQARIANGLGTACGRAGRFEEAAHWFQVSAQLLAPKLRHLARQNVAACLLRVGRFRQALAEMRHVAAEAEAFGRMPLDFNAPLIHAVAAALAGDEDDVARWYDQALYILQRDASTVLVADDLPMEQIAAAEPSGPRARALLAAVCSHLSTVDHTPGP